jgi:putative ABC transport system permease protein
MFSNYLKIGWRNLLKNKLFSIINIAGMAISIACFLIISLFVADELMFDRHVQDSDLKYRVFIDYYSEGSNMRSLAMVPPMIGPEMVSELPEVESYQRFMYINSSVLFEVGEKKLMEEKGAYSDPSVFDMFTLRLAEGDAKTALKEPGTVAISQSLARKYFGDKPALNEIIEISNEAFKVSAVFLDFPAHSHLQLDYFLSMANLYREIPDRMERWTWQQFHTYIKVKPGANRSRVEKKLQEMAERYAWPESKPNGSYYIPHLMEMRKVHLHSANLMWDIAVRGSAQTVYILSATALFIIIIAILNFINLSTARAVNRVKEVGVRKVVGAVRTQLIYQFISESVIVALIALLIGGLITELTLPFLNTFTEKSIPTAIFLNPLLVMIVLAFAFAVGVAAGAYPAFYISSYKPAMILSNKRSGRSGKILFRQGLVVLQFILSFFLITAALVVSDQHSFMRNTDMGFTKDNVIVLPLRGEMSSNLESTKSAFSSHPNILNSSLGYGLPGEAYAGDGLTDLERNKDMSISMLITDFDYVKTLDLKLIAGRDFSKDFPSDSSDAFIVSESGARLLGYQDPKDALEHKVGWNRWDGKGVKKGKVIGVVKDFHLNSLREDITPIVIHIFPFGYSTLTLKIKGENIPETLKHLESTWKKFNSEWPFEYRFLDDNFDKLYKSEEKLAVLFKLFTAFTIFVACLGLFGLVVYSTTQRYKEISIRKVLGANESMLVMGLARNYMLLIAIAFVIAIPFTYYAAHKWLEGFAYRIDITPMLFVKAGLLIMSLALLTVGVQSLKAARSNPVNALKEQ